MDIQLFLRDQNASSTWEKESHHFVGNFNESKFHLLFSLLCIVMYSFKIAKKSDFSSLSIFHSMMYFSTFLSVFCLLVVKIEMAVVALNIAFFLAHIPVFLNSFFHLAVISFHLTLMIFEVNPSFVIDKKLLITIGSVIIGMGKFLYRNVLIILTTTNGSKAEFDFIETGLLFLTVILLAIVLILFKLKIIAVTKAHVTIGINCFVYILFLFLSHLATIVLVVFEPGIPFTFGGYATNVYYLPFLWILSVYIAEFRAMQNYIRKNEKSCEVPEFQLAYIAVG